jgi:ribosomal protein S18 acetylase RimI-like enzyme
MRLRGFEPGDADTVAGWPESAEECRRWCSRDAVSAEVVAGWATTADVYAYTLVEGEELVGYGELWRDDEEGEVELARLIVAPAHRGRGLGRHLVSRLTELARAHHPAVFMRVHPDNTAALRCYTGAGYTPVPQEQADAWNSAQPVPYTWLTWSARA